MVDASFKAVACPDFHKCLKRHADKLSFDVVALFWEVKTFAVVLCENEDGSSSPETDPLLDGSCSLSVVNDTSSLCGDDFLLGLETRPGFVDVNNIELIPRDCTNGVVIGGPLRVAEEEHITRVSFVKPIL
ncbi:abscisic insensitive 1B [Striga asiatica]|uniref:Abscisic insensitive 1B n=1 Tax=Striga asiatica TaxID=4170 RepID=A0A5A7RK02_STRAF|nr:abscisic insensitive 1B [Striga asiatica]